MYIPFRKPIDNENFISRFSFLDFSDSRLRYVRREFLRGARFVNLSIQLGIFKVKCENNIIGAL